MCFVVLLRIIKGLGEVFMEAGEVRVRGQGYERGGKSVVFLPKA